MRSARHGVGLHVRRLVSDVVGTLLAVAIFSAAARAQTPVQPVPPAPPGTDGQAPSSDLSHRLDRSQGVIPPKPDVDPDMQVAPPDPNPGTMPVIPPPGSPGGDPHVQPK